MAEAEAAELEAKAEEESAAGGMGGAQAAQAVL